MTRLTFSVGIFPLAFLLLLSGSANACLNDRDTLAEEIKGLPDVVQVVTGRFERNPPLYYEMRLARVAAELKANPNLLPDYDDAGVACDRLGRDDEAIDWMSRKLTVLSAMRPDAPAFQEQWYRYNANLGTFLVHRWIRNGADRRQIGEVKAARKRIAEAIKIKPDAHFGREKYQLQVMDWILTARPYQAPPLPTTSEFGDAHTIVVANEAPPEFLAVYLGRQQDETKALCGLITLGNAWESVDVFHALGHSFTRKWPERYDQLTYLTSLRCSELIDAGKGSLLPGAPKGEFLKMALRLDQGFNARRSDDERIYHQLRAEADDWQKKRTAYMMARLQAGRHPDTDSTFWNDYHDPGPPKISIPLERRLYLAVGPFLGMPEEISVVLWPVFLGGCGLMVLRFWLRRRKRQEKGGGKPRSSRSYSGSPRIGG